MPRSAVLPEASAVSALTLHRPAVQGARPRATSLVRWWMADGHLALAIATVVPVVLVEAAHGAAASVPTLAAALVYLGGQVVLARVPGVRTRGAWQAVRLASATLFVAILTIFDGAASGTLPALYIPIVALASAMTARAGGATAALAIGLYFTILGMEHGWHTVLHDGLVPASVTVFIALGTRRVVASLEHSFDRLRRSTTADRRRARRLRAIEQVGQILAQDGPSPAALESIMEVLARTFGYRYLSVYLWTGGALRLGAQRGYERPFLEIDLDVGIIGRVARTGEAVFAPNVAIDPDYAMAYPDVASEIAVPLLSGDELLGVLNVESTTAEPLERDDFASLRTIADRLSVSIALGRERRALAERAGLLGRLAAAFTELGGALDPEALQTTIAQVATTVVTSDIGLLALVNGPRGGSTIVAAHGAEQVVGMQLGPGEGAAGRAIATRAPVLEDQYDADQYPRGAASIEERPTLAVMSIPVIRDGAVLGAVTFVRREVLTPYTDQEREIAGLFAAQVALAIANASLLAEAREAAIRDPLTQLHNRRFLDDSLARMSAGRARQRPMDRRPIAAILFDLDHFGDLNNRYGHSVGDAVLRAFAGLLAGRFRSADLVARYGGEEFLVVLDGASRDDAVRAAEDIRIAFRQLDLPVPGGEVVRATVSAGCAALHPSVAPLDQMIEVADVGLAMAKAGGRDQVVAA